jgi:hypothetical protein
VKTSEPLLLLGGIAGAGGVYLVIYSGALGSSCLVGAKIIVAGAVLLAFCKAARLERLAGIGSVVAGIGGTLTVPGLLGIVSNGVLVPVDTDTRLIIAIGAAACSVACVAAGLGKIWRIRQVVDRAYVLYGLGAILGGVGAVMFSYRRGITFAAADAGTGVLVAGVIAGLLLGMVAFGLGNVSRAGSHAILFPPGTRARPILQLVYSERTYSGVFRPVIADTQNEWLEAKASRRYWRARWIALRGYVLLVENVFLQLPLSAVKIAVRIWKLGS